MTAPSSLVVPRAPQVERVQAAATPIAPRRRRGPRYSSRGARIFGTGLAALAVVGAGVAAARAAGYRVNVSASVPLGLWRVDPEAPLHRGAMTLWCPPDNALFRAARAHRAVPYGPCPGRYAPLFKPAAAVAGDVVEVAPAGVRINGVALPNTAQRRPQGASAWVPLIPAGTYHVPVGEVWFISTTNPYSFDSRYYGPMPVARVQGVARPVWTWDPYAAVAAVRRKAAAPPAAAGLLGRAPR